MPDRPSFEFHVGDGDIDIDSRLLVGTASPGMAGLVAVDHLVSGDGVEQFGHARARNLPAVTPFNEGVPRYPIRLYGSEAGPTVLVSEVFHPVGVGEVFADAITSLAREHGVEEITALYGAPYPHGPDDHAVFSVSTETYPTDRLRGAGIKPLSGGFFDGYVGAILADGMAPEAPAVGALVTPAHPPGPDFDGALRLLAAVAAHFGMDVDTGPIEQRSEEMHRYYAELADRMEASREETDYPEDRMYM